MTRVLEPCDDTVHGIEYRQEFWSIMMTRAMEHCDDTAMEHCDDKKIGRAHV